MRQRFSGGFSKQARFTRFLKKDMSVFKLMELGPEALQLIIRMHDFRLRKILLKHGYD